MNEIRDACKAKGHGADLGQCHTQVALVVGGGGQQVAKEA